MLWGITGRSRNSQSNGDTTLNQSENNNINNNNTNTNTPDNNVNNNNNNQGYNNSTNNATTNHGSTENNNTNNIQNSANRTTNNTTNRTNISTLRTNNRRRNSRQNRRSQRTLPTLRTRLIKHDDEWGDPFNHNKDDDVFRIGLRNINGLPIDASHMKNYEIFSDIRTGKFDVFGITETNLAWHTLTESDRINERIRGKLEFMRYSSSYNRDMTFTDKRQYGGTMTISQGSSSGRVVTTGRDNCQLGRWSWMKFRGKNNLTLRVVTVYRPVLLYGASSTFQQHQLFMNQFHLTGCPRDKLIKTALE